MAAATLVATAAAPVVPSEAGLDLLDHGLDRAALEGAGDGHGGQGHGHAEQQRGGGDGPDAGHPDSGHPLRFGGGGLGPAGRTHLRRVAPQAVVGVERRNEPGVVVGVVGERHERAE